MHQENENNRNSRSVIKSISEVQSDGSNEMFRLKNSHFTQG